MTGEGVGATYVCSRRTAPLPLRSLKGRSVLRNSDHCLDHVVTRPSFLLSLRRGISGVMIIIPACLLGVVSASVPAATLAGSLVSLTQGPLVMRLSNDQFRVAFGINGDQCFPIGCRGSIRYRVTWSTEDGITRAEIREVSYAVAPNSHRSITVDRQYFDTAEGEHTTKVVSVTVDTITCRRGTEPRAPARAWVSPRTPAGPSVSGNRLEQRLGIVTSP
jgi:hypothetical protein